MIYLFSENTTCATLSMKARWRPLVPASTQITEMIIGTNMVGKPIPATDTAAPGAGEFNFTYGMSSTETRASSGTMTLTKYTPGVAVEGTVNVMYPGGAVTGTFHADWCAGGREM